ncbi:MAG: von Willebrand factor, type [Proteobacteria bacterium]|nr:von Willebrand factor, type [Pseudomonadota bacterium]
MSASDGYVAGTTKIVDHGPDSARWNLIILGDGYQASQLTQYHTDVQNFLNTLRLTPPYDELFCGINVHRIDVVSTDSGADDPTLCAGGTGATPRTFFDATFCSVGPGGVRLDRLLTVDSSLALSTAASQVTIRHQIMVIVNSSKYGGSGGSIAVCSTNIQSAQIAIHEIGHSAYGLADEYGGDGTGTPSGEPPQPNVTRDTNRATNKWRALILSTTPLPSSCDGSCVSSSCVPPGIPPASGAVGTYEGGDYSDCNVYRPLPSCYMRDYSPFCPVCAGVIRQTIQPFLPAESINLTTPSINFLNVPAGMGGVGVTTYRAIVFDVVSCRTLTFQVTSGPSGGFGLPNGPSVSVTADPILPTAAARLWLSYTSTNPGDSAAGSVTVRCVQTGQTWVINISANTIARPHAAITLVLDRSGSMNDDAGDAVTKVQKLREATNTFISILQANDGIGLVRFNQAAQRIMEVQEAGPATTGAGRVAALGHINSSEIDPSGSTSIGDGVIKGKQMLDDAQAAASPPYDVEAMVVLTDGMWNQPPPLSSVSGSITANTYAIGFGLPSNISVPALTTLCQGHNGFLLVTGQITPDQTMRLNKYFLQILAGVTNAQIAADPAGELYGNAEHRIPFWINEADFGMDLILLSPFPQVIDFKLETPDGTLITPASGFGGANSQFVMSQYASYYRCALPVLPADPGGNQAGLWYAVLKLGQGPAGGQIFTRQQEYQAAAFNSKRGGLPYEFVAHTYSSLTFQAVARQTSYDVGALVQLSATLLEYDAPLLGQAQVWCEITRPDGGMDTLLMSAAGSGQFTAAYPLLSPGLYSLRVRARGQTRYGSAFERERLFTATTVPGGDIWNPNDPQDSELCTLLHCLLEQGVLTEQTLSRLKELGVEIGPLLKCLYQSCRERGGVNSER